MIRAPVLFWFFVGLVGFFQNASSLQSPTNGVRRGDVSLAIAQGGTRANCPDQYPDSIGVGRKEFFAHLLAVPAAGLLTVPRQALAEDAPAEGLTMFKTKSGLKYLELLEGSGPTPRYGQLCAIQYTGYLKLPTESKPQKFDSNSFLIKHGNGRTIAGLDEGIHTMKVGGRRRIIIPPKLGYVNSGLGPIPELPWNRWSLNQLLSQMVDQRGGNLVFEVELKSVIDDEADQGYYEDESPTPEEFEKLRLNFQERSAAAAVAREAAENSTL